MRKLYFRESKAFLLLSIKFDQLPKKKKKEEEEERETGLIACPFAFRKSAPGSEFRGINYSVEVYLTGHKKVVLKGMFWRHSLNVTDIVRCVATSFKGNMKAKGMHTSCDCPVCGEEPESLIHALIYCDSALTVWSLWNDCPIRLLLNAKDYTDLAHQILSSSTTQHLEYFFAISWSIWYNRNMLVHKEHGLLPLQLWEKAKNIVEDFQEAITMDFPPQQPIHWSMPPRSSFKVNVDGGPPQRALGTQELVWSFVTRREGC